MVMVTSDVNQTDPALKLAYSLSVKAWLLVMSDLLILLNVVDEDVFTDFVDSSALDKTTVSLG